MCESVWFQATDQWWIDADRPVHVSIGRLRVSIDLLDDWELTCMYLKPADHNQSCVQKPKADDWLTRPKSFIRRNRSTAFRLPILHAIAHVSATPGNEKIIEGPKNVQNPRFVMRQWWYLSFWRTSILHFNVLQNNALIGIHTKIAHPLLSRAIESIHSLEQIKTESGLKGQ